jgi:hypothetical protein
MGTSRPTTSPWTFLLGLLIFAAGLNTPERAPAGELKSEAYQAFKGPPEGKLVFQLRGPDAAQRVQFELDGLRIALPAGQPEGITSTGVVTRALVRGDFEITAGFEVLKEIGQSRCSLIIDLDRPNKNMAILSRQTGAKVKAQFLAWVTLWDEKAAREHTQSKPITTQAQAGQFRLKRSGPLLSYHVATADSSDFQKLQEYEFGVEDVKAVHLVAATTGKDAALDVRFADLRLRAESLPGLEAVAAAAGQADEVQPGQARIGWTTWVVALFLLAVAGSAALIVRRAGSKKSTP